MGLDLCRASHVKRPCAILCPGGRQTNTYALLCPPTWECLPHSGFSPLRLCRCASAFDGWVEIGGFGCRPLVGRGYSRALVVLMRGTFMGSPNGKPMGSTQFFDWPGMGLDLCRAFHVNGLVPHSTLVGGSQIPIPSSEGLPHSGFSPLRLCRCASACDSWVEVGDFGCRPLWGEGSRVHPWSLMRGTFMVPRVRVHRKHAIFRLARHGSRSVPGFPRKTALCHTLPLWG